MESQYLLLIDHGSYEGWGVLAYDSLDELLLEIEKGCSLGQPFKIAKELKLTIKETT